MPKPSYELMYNQDDSALFHQTKQQITPDHVDAMVDEVAGGGADAMLICVNAQMASYPSRVWQRNWARGLNYACPQVGEHYLALSAR